MKKANRKARAIAAISILISLTVIVIIVFYLIGSQKRHAREKTIYDAVRAKENEGDNYFYILNDFIRAEESYLEAEKLAEELPDRFDEIIKRIGRKLASDEIRKYKKGYILFEGRWVGASEISVPEKIRLEWIQQRRREIEQAMRKKSGAGKGTERPAEGAEKETRAIEE